MDSFQDYKVHVWSFDTEVHNPEIFTPDKDITEYQPGGFGGTEFEANWTWMKENGVASEKPLDNAILTRLNNFVSMNKFKKEFDEQMQSAEVRKK